MHLNYVRIIKLKVRSNIITKSNQYEVIIIGAGAVGLFTGNLLGQLNIKTLIIDKEQKVKKGSRAIGIAPISLKLLKSLRLDKIFIKNGVKVKKAFVHGTNKEIGSIVFDRIPSDYPFILSIPQEVTERLLEKNIKKFSSVRLIRGKEAVDIILEKEKALVKIMNNKNKKEESYECKYLCGCDGKNSFVRTKLKIKYNGGRYKETFLMADFIDESNYGYNAHLFFTSIGPVESFPLPNKKRRWIVETNKFLEHPDKTFLEEEVFKRSGIKLDPAKKIAESPFGVHHYLASSYYKDNVILCGDAAHMMSPIGGQGMNTGLGDAELCSYMIYQILKYNKPAKLYFKKYEHYRKIAAKAAMFRAGMSMKIGTMKGFILSGLRNIFIKYFLMLFKDTIPVVFSMLNIPYSNISKTVKNDKLLCKSNNFDESKK